MCLLCGLSFSRGAEPALKVHVDQRVELLGIVAKLAGYPEYQIETDKEYSTLVTEHFAPYKEHELIAYARELRKNKGISYDAIPVMALSLTTPPELGWRVSSMYSWATPTSQTEPLEMGSGGQLSDMGWDPASTEKFAALLRQFYQEARCDEFFKACQPRYDRMEKDTAEMVKGIDTNWITNFFGNNQNLSFAVLPSLTVDDKNSYSPGLMMPESMELYTITGSVKNSSEINMRDHAMLGFILANTGLVVRRNMDQLEGPALRVQDVIGEKSGFYGPAALLTRNLAMSIGVRYMLAHGADPDTVRNVMENMVAKGGYTLVPRLVGLLDKYEKDRNKYPDLDSFIPEIAAFFDQYSQQSSTLALSVPKVEQHRLLNGCFRTLSVFWANEHWDADFESAKKQANRQNMVLSAAKEKFRELEEELKENPKEFGEVEETMREIQKTIRELEGEIRKNPEKIREFEEEFRRNPAELQSLQEKINELQRKLDRNPEKIKNLEEIIKVVRGKLGKNSEGEETLEKLGPERWMNLGALSLTLDRFRKNPQYIRMFLEIANGSMKEIKEKVEALEKEIKEVLVHLRKLRRDLEKNPEASREELEELRKFKETDPMAFKEILKQVREFQEILINLKEEDPEEFRKLEEEFMKFQEKIGGLKEIIREVQEVTEEIKEKDPECFKEFLEIFKEEN